jgi:serine/threonine protein kinase/formylglycine-generating enzyme required for sulfatase activity
MDDELDSVPTQRVTPDEAVTRRPSVRSFKHYDLLSEIGVGGMGKVWLARDRGLNNTEVALKFLKSELANDPQAREDLVREVLNNRELNHANILKAYNLETDEQATDLSMRCAISMDFIKGESLSRKLASRLKAAQERGDTKNVTFDVEEIQKWVFQLCDAMQHAHEALDKKTRRPKPIIHRDIKPANLMIHENGDLKVCDFGIGCAVAETMSRLTNQAATSGTLPYMSPQQVDGKMPAASHDIYSIGATIYELLTGKPPYFRGDTAMLINQIKDEKEKPPSMEARRKELGFVGKPIPVVWERTVAACLAKDSEARPPSAKAIRDMLEGRRVRKPGNKTALIASAAALAVAAGAGFAYWKFFMPAPSVTRQIAGGTVTAPAARTESARRGEPASPVETLLSAGNISPDEAVLLNKALSGVHGTRERDLAARVAIDHSLTPAAWRDFSGLVTTSDDTVLKLRPMVATNLIREAEFMWLRAAVAGDKGDFEKVLARQLLEAKTLTPEQWRSQSEVNPQEKRDPLVEKVKPLLATNAITVAEGQWLREALAGTKTEAEKALAVRFVDDKSVTAGQWRARTAFSYALKPEVVPDLSTLPVAIDLPITPALTMRLVRIDGGAFIHGSPKDELGRRNNDLAAERVVIPQPFYLGIYEVKQSEFTGIMGRGQSWWKNHPDYPMDSVSWQSLAGPNGFLAKVNATLALRHGGVLVAELPTEDEWEFACRAGTQTAFNSGRNITNIESDPELDSLANYNRTANGSPMPVGSFRPNAFGLYDMHGNLSEWCSARILRGGSWQSKAADCRSAYRQQLSGEPPTDSLNKIGFRLAIHFKKKTD